MEYRSATKPSVDLDVERSRIVKEFPEQRDSESVPSYQRVPAVAGVIFKHCLLWPTNLESVELA